jgi:hypothetical protein
MMLGFQLLFYLVLSLETPYLTLYEVQVDEYSLQFFCVCKYKKINGFAIIVLQRKDYCNEIKNNCNGSAITNTGIAINVERVCNACNGLLQCVLCVIAMRD